MREFKDNINWNCISRYQKLSEEFMKKFNDRIDWNKINWHRISRCQIISEEFMRKFNDKIDWNHVSKNERRVYERF